jgi:orotidine-5'-phosphate decarboxylase
LFARLAAASITISSELSSQLSKPISELNSATSTSDKILALTDLSGAYLGLSGSVDNTTPLHDVFLDAANLTSELGLAGAANGTDDQVGLKADMATVAKNCPAEASMLAGSADAAARAAP